MQRLVFAARVLVLPPSVRYQAFVDGKPVAPNTLLAPGWTDFHKRVLYQTYDVTSLVRPGENTLGVLLGEDGTAPR